MKKFIFVCLFIFVGFVSSQVYAGWEIADTKSQKIIGIDSWKQLRILHAEYLGKNNYTGHGTTDKWIAQDMNRWLSDQRNEFERKISDLKRENTCLKNKNKKLNNTLNGDGDNSNRDGDGTMGKNIIEQNQSLREENSNLKDELDCCKNRNIIAYSIIGIILVLFIAFILIKKCQAKKIPQGIEEAIASHDN